MMPTISKASQKTFSTKNQRGKSWKKIIAILVTLAITNLHFLPVNQFVWANSQNQQPSMKNEASNAKQKQNWGQALAYASVGASAALAAMYAAKCSSKNPSACRKAILYTAGAVLSGVASQKLFTSQKGSSNVIVSLGPDISTPQPNSPPPSERTPDPINPPGEDNLREVCKTLRYCGDLKTGVIRTPDGRTINLNQENPQKELAKLGIDPKELQEAMQTAIQQADNRLASLGHSSKMENMGNNSNIQPQGDQTSGTDATFRQEFDSPSALAGSLPDAFLTTQNPERNLASLNPKLNSPEESNPTFKNVNGTPILVSEENIFEVINRRYEIQARKGDLSPQL